MEEIKTEAENDKNFCITSLVLSIVAIPISLISKVNSVALCIGIAALVLSITAFIRRSNRRLNIISLITAILVIIFILIIQSIFTRRTSNILSSSKTTYADKETLKVLEKELDIKPSMFVIWDNVREGGIKETHLHITITNKSTETKSFIIELEAVDTEGNILETDVIGINALEPGQIEKVKAFTNVKKENIEALRTADFKVSKAASY